MTVKDFCDVIMDKARITIIADVSGYEIIENRLWKSDLRKSKYWNKEICLIRTFGVMGKDDFDIMLEEE